MRSGTFLTAASAALMMAFVSAGCGGGDSPIVQDPLAVSAADDALSVSENAAIESREEALIAEAQPFLVRQADGTLAFNPPSTISAEARQFGEAEVAIINQLVKDGDDTVDAQLDVHPTDDGTSRAIRITQQHSWGVVLFADSSSAQQVAARLIAKDPATAKAYLRYAATDRETYTLIHNIPYERLTPNLGYTIEHYNKANGGIGVSIGVDVRGFVWVYPR